MTEPSFAELKERLTVAESELQAAESRLQLALKAAAVDDTLAGEVASVRAQIEGLRDRIDGLRMLAKESELAELWAEIERRETAHALQGEKVNDLYEAFNRPRPAPEGVGSAFGDALRNARTNEQEAFRRYELANIAYLDEAKAIAALRKRYERRVRGDRAALAIEVEIAELTAALDARELEISTSAEELARLKREAVKFGYGTPQHARMSEAARAHTELVASRDALFSRRKALEDQA